MDKLDELVNADDILGFENLDTVFPEDKQLLNETDEKQDTTACSSTEEDLYEVTDMVEEIVPEAPKKRRGRPPKAKITQSDEAKNNTRLDETKIKKKIQTKVKIDEIPLEILDKIYNWYSIKPIKHISQELEIPVDIIESVMYKLNELFLLNIASGGLTQEDYDKYVSPKMIKYSHIENFETFVNSEIREIQKN